MTVTQVKVSQDNEETLDNINDCSTLCDTDNKLSSDINELPALPLVNDKMKKLKKIKNNVTPKRKYVKKPTEEIIEASPLPKNTSKKENNYNKTH